IDNQTTTPGLSSTSHPSAHAASNLDPQPSYSTARDHHHAPQSPPDQLPLTLEAFELDAIASVVSKSPSKKRRPPPPPPPPPPQQTATSHRSVSPASSQTLTPSMPNDLMTFDGEREISSNNPFWASLVTTTANPGSVSPTLTRPRRRPPPPPPSSVSNVS
ncbi:hypothetical protein GGF43_005305, partial [Coemansia sp. RSA 2618]